MKTLCLLFCALQLSLWASAQKDVAQEVCQLSHQKFIWMQQRDTTSLSRLLHPTLRYIHSNGWTESRTDVLRDIADSILVYHAVQISWDTSVVHSKHTAIVTGRGVFDVSLRGTRGQYPLLYTEVYAREGKHWMLVQRHACKQP